MQDARRALLSLLGLAPLVWPGAARAQIYPARPIRLIVADPPGGAPDQLGRIVAQRLSDALGQQVVVDNKPGASGILGADVAARAEPDGHVLLLSTTAIWAIMPSVKKTLPYDPTTSFVPITRIATASNVLVVNPDLPAKSVAELVALAKASPGRINYASAGVASPAHLAGEMLNLRGGVKMTHIPYKGAAPALLDVIAGSAQLIITSPVSAGGHIANGKVRALATTGAQRNPVLPDLPTIGETLPGYDISQSWGFVAPAGTPQPVIHRLYGEIAKALAEPDVRERIAKTGAVPVTETPEAFAGFMVAERQRLADVIVKSGIALND
jgi:tripartite-type tricarboxylate transporter receptor subunit TctC